MAYLNPELAVRISPSAMVDRFVRGLHSTYEHVVTISLMTNDEGRVIWAIGLELRAEGVDSAVIQTLAVYPYDGVLNARADGVTLATQLHVACRCASFNAPAEWLYHPDVVPISPNPTPPAGT